jgi:hypothetical protein
LKIRDAFALFCWLALAVPLLHAQSPPPDLVLTGKVFGSQNKSYFEVPFSVPANTHRVSVDFSYTGKDQKTTLDIGIADPERFRGNSGGNKSHFTIGESDATPSYLPGAILPGQWKLLISVPNIRASEESTYRAEIRFNDPLDDQGFSSVPLETRARWYRGDLHMHTAHSDGSCASQSGKQVPCPLFFTAQAAAQRGLDFIAITDHNTTSQYEAMRELQPYFDRLLLIPGREITTFWGHFNIFGSTEFNDYRVVPNGGRDVNAIVREARAQGAIASINHAGSPDGESCMGCAWKPTSPIDISLFTGFEVINGAENLLSSADVWDRELASGVRLTAVGGSDNHHALDLPGNAGAVGSPTTVVAADELSVPAILDGIRRGRVLIALTGSRNKVVDLEARNTNTNQAANDNWAPMGSIVKAASGDPIAFRVLLSACPRSTVHLFLDGHEAPSLGPLSANSSNEMLPFAWTSDGGRHWVRVEVRDSNGSLILISNPIYINF